MKARDSEASRPQPARSESTSSQDRGDAAQDFLTDAYFDAQSLCRALRRAIEARDKCLLPPDDLEIDEEPRVCRVDYTPVIPDEMCNWVGSVSGQALKTILEAVPLMVYRNADATIFIEGIELRRVPNRERIRALLESGKEVTWARFRKFSESVRG